MQQTRPFTYMQQEFADIKGELAKKVDADEMYRRFDAVMAELDDIKTEQAAYRVQLNRHERWHGEVADHLGLTLSPEA